MHVVSDRHVPDVFRDFFLISFVNEDEGIMFRVVPIVDHPFLTWVVSFLIAAAANGDVGRGRGCGCHSLEERRRLILHCHDVS
jgi:hypothetical protein